MIPMKTVAKSVDTRATERPRGSRRRVSSRTSGFRVKAITAAVRKRKRTWPSVRASRNASSSTTGRPTSWIQRGIRILVASGIGPIVSPSVARPDAG